MHKLVLPAAVCVAFVGVALAQVEASSSTYLLDVDTARYVGPASQRLMLRVGDQPRSITIGTQDEICVQLQRVEGNSEVIAARIRALRPQPRDATEVRLVGPDISPGTYRSTPWGMLLRALPEKTGNVGMSKPLGTESAPVCTL
ncbi:MAG TPA: hypothetical protein VNM71_01590 [Steroidobacteraceae bacterium]|jgi:hypothetical protein|nr:hypothetical protein [Steroidobacteraceae bacterium]